MTEFNPNCGKCGMLNSRGFCSLTACRFPVVNGLGTWQERILANKPKQTNGDRVRAMTDDGIEDWYWWMHKEMMRYTDSRLFVHDWLKAPVEKIEE